MRKERRKNKKITQYIKKRPRFLKILLNCFIPLLIIGGVIAGGITYIASSDYMSVYEKQAMMSVQDIDEGFLKIHSEDENSQDKSDAKDVEMSMQILLGKQSVYEDSSFFSYFDNWHHSFCVEICDNNTKEIIAEGIPCYKVLERTGKSLDGESHMYICNQMEMSKAEEALSNYLMEHGKSWKEADDYEMYYRDIYVKGNRFYPGVVDYVKLSVKDNHFVYDVVVSVDMTPQNIESFRRIENDYKNDATLINMFKPYNGRDFDGCKAFLSELKAQDEMWGHGIGASGVKKKKYYYVDSFWTTEEKAVQLFLVAEYSFWEDCGMVLFIIYIGILILLFVVSIVVAYRYYVVQKAQYEMASYRKRLMNEMAHDLKSPLTAMAGFAENLKMNVNTQKRDYYVDTIINNVGYMTKLVNDILDLSELENQNEIEIEEKQQLKTKELFQETICLYEQLINEKQIDVEVQGEGILIGNQIRMRQVLDNLIGNAVKFVNDEGMISIIIEENGFEIRNDFDCSEKLQGMDLKRLYEPFVKGDISRGNRKGNGIGLSIVQNLLTKYGYTISLDVQDNQFVVKVCL